MWRAGAISLAVAAWLVGAVAAGWPLCKQRCDSSYNKEQLLEHPGVASVCHRGCELFTVALLASPHGGLPLLEKKFVLSFKPVKVDLEPKLTSLLQNYSKKTQVKNKDKQPEVKEDDTLNGSSKKKPDKIVTVNAGKTIEKVRDVMKKVEEGKQNMKELPKSVHKQKASEENIFSDQKHGHETPELKTPNLKHKTSQFVVSHEKLAGNQQHIQFIKPFTPPYKTALKPGIVKIPIKILEGAPAKQIIEEARQAEETVVVETSKAHGPVHIEPATAGPSKAPKVGHSIVENKPKPETTKTKQIKKVPHGPVSKTTVQPASHPVQDHPVHASRQITTDSSGADERKTTTPQSSSPSMPLDHKTPEFDVFAKLANKLGSSVNKGMVPHMEVSFDDDKSFLPAPLKVSLIEIIKRKYDIDFEKLHREHMEDVIHCPMIFERFEEAKHSCRHACTKAYTGQKEQEACVAGCQLQASSSSDQVRTQLAQPELAAPEGLFSAVRRMVSSFASHIGQSLRSAWSGLTGPRAEDGSRLSGLGPVQEVPLPRGSGEAELKPADQKQSSHVGFEVYIEKSGPHTVQTKTIIGPKGRIIDAETIVQVSSRSSSLTPAQMLHQQLDNHKKVMHQEMEMQGKLLAEDPSNIEIELNRQLEVMGKHLTEDAKKVGGDHPFFQPLFMQFLLPKVNGKEGPENQISWKTANDKEKHHTSLFENLFPFSSSFTGVLHSDEKKLKGLETEDVLFRHNSEVKDEKKSTNMHDGGEQSETSNSERQTTRGRTISVQQLDLLDCISRKSGLPHWLIVFSLYTSVLVVFWLCFLLYAYIVELRELKHKVPTLVCEAAEPLLDNGCESKNFFSPDDSLDIPAKTV